ncbi:MAG TPA: LmbU family transcriptional regulator [Streptosporangiaceae bacterium]|nr:LmbU family transcriptional regulator [Streptosporangiaceae bacterium]
MSGDYGAPFLISRKGLQLPVQLSFEKWLSVGSQLSDICTSSAWCLGDWLVYGEEAYAGRYREAIEQTSLDYQTLRNYAWVVRRFSLSRRRDTLSFGHHAEVAALPEPEQNFWLRKAEEFGWSVKRLRREVRMSLTERSVCRDRQHDAAQDQSQQEWSMASLEIPIALEKLELCQAAAERSGLSMEAWAASALEQAAHYALDGSGPTAPAD